MAISNWHRTLVRRALGGMVGLWLTSAAAYDSPKSSLSPKFVAVADRGLAEARTELAAGSNDVGRIWRLGRALFFRAEFTAGKERSELAEEGIAVCERGLALSPASAECHYYLAMNQGQLAREKLFGALGLVRDMRDHLLRAAAVMPKLDYAGPDRCLALLYRDAPGWPISVGDGKAAGRHLDRACSLNPGYPGNFLVRLESQMKRGDRKALKEQMVGGAALLEKAKGELTGPAWDPYHHDWSARWIGIRKQLGLDSAD